MKKLIRILPFVIIFSLTLTGCLPTEETPTDTLQTEEEFLTYLQASEDELLSALDEYYSPVNIPEGMSLNRIEVQPERHLITYYYNLGRYEPTIEELAEEATKDIDLSAFSLFGMFPTANRQKETYGKKPKLWVHMTCRLRCDNDVSSGSWWASCKNLDLGPCLSQ